MEIMLGERENVGQGRENSIVVEEDKGRCVKGRCVLGEV